jgi:hypothetical protein
MLVELFSEHGAGTLISEMSARPQARPQACRDTWLFDLDNTLYPAEFEFMALIEGRMTDFVDAGDRAGAPGGL